jgi:ribosomal protein S18 acetylase RimI-like enzyme
MHIEKMRDEHLSVISEVDNQAFDRNIPRTTENLKVLKGSDPDGCFISKVDGKIVAYIFSKTFGSEGFLGPIGVHPEYQGKGIGKYLLEKSIDYLTTRCDVIGLEVVPEKVRNIEIYNRLGFVSAFPSYVFDINTLSQGTISNYKVNSCSINKAKLIFEIIDSLEDSTVYYKNDAEAVLSTGGNIIVINNEKRPCGFLAYSKTCLPYIWGVFRENKHNEDAVREGLISICSSIRDNRHQLIVNTRYRNAVETLLNLGCKVSKCINRMLLKGFEGDYLHESDKWILKPWIG